MKVETTGTKWDVCIFIHFLNQCEVVPNEYNSSQQI